MRWSVRAFKRTIDLIVAALGLCVVLPAFPVIAIAIYTNSPGPIFYRQRRAGRLLRVVGPNRFEFDEFNMYKFRSMRTDAEKLTGAVLAQQDDPRVTRVGRFLRKTRLDELPQLWNVLKGDMSLVGPRPERPELLSALASAIPFFEERMRGVRPGVTGLAQISLGYSGGARPGSEVEQFVPNIANPFDLGDAAGAEADDMRLKLLYDMAYVASLEQLRTFLPMEFRVMIMTPLVMIRVSAGNVDESLSIVHVVFSLGVGGQERVILDLATAQIEQGHDVTTLVLSPPDPQDLEEEFKRRKISVFRVPKGHGVRPELLLRLTRWFIRGGIRVVHTHNPMPLIYAAPAGRFSGAIVIHTKHGEHRDSALRMAMRRQSARFVDAFVAVSEPTAAFARVHKECAPDKLMVIKNGTDLGRFARDAQARQRIRAELGIAEDAFVAICVGRFVPEKAQKDLLKAATPLLSDSFHLVFAGDGPLFGGVKSSAPAGSHFLGQRADIPELLAAADAYVISSVTEGLPIGLIEAMASCLPVISTSVGGIPTVLQGGKLGVLVPPGKPERMRAALEEVRANPESARARAAQARSVAFEEFGVNRMVRDYSDLYREVLTERGKL